MFVQTDLYSFSYKKGSLLPLCKRCGAENFYKDGKNSQEKQLYKCKKCGFRFVWTSDLPKRNFFSNVISFAVELYATAGISLRKIARDLKKYFDIIVSHECIRQWVLAAKNLIIKDDKPVPTKTWHIDETYFKIKGEGFWLWVVYYKESRNVIAWHISKKHLLREAKTLLSKAMQQSQNVRPDRIITDGLWQYPVAIYKIMGWRWEEQKERHIIDSGIGKNAPIEEVNREVKRRYNWFGTFQSLESANTFFGLFFYHLNKRRFNYPNTG
jgi:transposase-like protein/DNA-directed RNA polymerase subunit RPC12/RpoP